MVKERQYHKSNSCYALMRVLDKAGATKDNPLPKKEALEKVEEIIGKNLKEIDLSKNNAGKIRWKENLEFAFWRYKLANILVRKNAFYHITDKGRQLLKEKTVAEIWDIVTELRKKYLAKKQKTLDKEEISLGNEENNELEDREENNELTIEDAETTALETIKNQLKRLGGYQFQDLVYELLKAMGYIISDEDVADKGADGGIDITAYTDKLKINCLPVQVKHNINSGTDISAKNIQALAGAISQRHSANDKGLFVCSTRFTRNAKESAKQLNIKLIDLSQLLSLWYANYEKITEKGKKLLPIKKVYFCTAEEE